MPPRYSGATSPYFPVMTPMAVSSVVPRAFARPKSIIVGSPVSEMMMLAGVTSRYQYALVMGFGVRLAALWSYAAGSSGVKSRNNSTPEVS